jgi:hypothetical protein
VEFSILSFNIIANPNLGLNFYYQSKSLPPSCDALKLMEFSILSLIIIANPNLGSNIIANPNATQHICNFKELIPKSPLCYIYLHQNISLFSLLNYSFHFPWAFTHPGHSLVDRHEAHSISRPYKENTYI